VVARHTFRFYDCVNQPYEVVRDTLLASPLAVFRHAITSVMLRNEAIGAEPDAKAEPLDIGAEVAIRLRAIEAGRSPNDHPAIKLVLECRTVRKPALFPTMQAELWMYALTPAETQLELCGTYEPPRGISGGAVDENAVHRVARESLASFVQDVARSLRGRLAVHHAA
jgi:hypothetical protein